MPEVQGTGGAGVGTGVDRRGVSAPLSQLRLDRAHGAHKATWTRPGLAGERLLLREASRGS
jgi:hypothetical protein